MNRRVVIPVIVVAIGVVAWSVRSRADQPPTLPEPIAAKPTQSVGQIQGIGGCAAAGCHNAPGNPGSPGTEYGTWIHDPHGMAAATLESPKYKQILKNLKGTPYTEELCLKCHATPTTDGSPLAKDLLADGIGCESCHGPSEKWRTTHYQSAWKALSNEQKQSYGMYPTKDLAARVAKCAECHVGNENKDVNHDLIAAGHPRLNFEFSAYHHLMKPRHWQEPHEKNPPGEGARADWEAHAWALGQSTTAKAAAELLEARAKHAGEATHPWPEYSEYGCYACHHDLKKSDDSWRRSRQYMGLPVGSLPWGTWTLPAVDLLDEIKGKSPPAHPLVDLMAKPFPPPAQVQAAAKKLRDDISANDLKPNQAQLTPSDVRSALLKLIAESDKASSIPDWESATQRYLAISALYHALGDMSPADRTAARTEAILKLREPLRFSAGCDSPRDFKPNDFLERLSALRPLFKE